jgi:hypothetical protein
MIRRLLQALDADGLAAVMGAGLAAQRAPPRAIAVDGRTLGGSRITDTTAWHVLAACDQATGIVLASTDVEGRTTGITRFAPLLDQIGDLRDVVIVADALQCQREHVTYLAGRGAHWIFTVKGNRPILHTQLTGLPWTAVPDAHRDLDRGHGRWEIRSLKALTSSTGIDFPHAAQAIQVRRRGHRLDQSKRFTTETIDAIADLRVHQDRPVHLAALIRGQWSIENRVCATQRLVCIPGSAGRDWRDISGSDGLPGCRKAKGTRACQQTTGRVQA